MSSFYQKSLTRRSAIVGALAALPMLRLGDVKANQYEPIQPVDLGHGLEIRDYRLFPTEDVMRFIVEIHNTTDTAVDTPTVGVELPHLAGENFGWANPVGTILHPGTSDILIGVAPQRLKSDDEWCEPEWFICDPIQTSMSESLDGWEVEFSHEFEIVDIEHVRIWFEIMNHGNKNARGSAIHGLVRDIDRRVCGAMLPVPIGFVRPGETGERSISIRPGVNYAANPFTLIETIRDFEVSLSLQYVVPAANLGCPSLLPQVGVVHGQ